MVAVLDVKHLVESDDFHGVEPQEVEDLPLDDDEPTALEAGGTLGNPRQSAVRSHDVDDHDVRRGDALLGSAAGHLALEERQHRHEQSVDH